jgi:hypothetical protein
MQSPLTTQEGMWRIYSNPDPHGIQRAYKNQYLIAILHPFSIETAHEPISTHIINQAIINLDISS